jgi:FtsP/CotA-like multicopper oxidase with cupredoxin domain
VNTNNGALTASVTGVPYRLVAVDGNNLNKPAAVRGRSLLVAAGGRADLEVTTPSDGSSIRVDVGGGGTYLTIGGKHSTPVSLPRRQAPLDLLTYGATRPIGFDPAAADRTFDYRIGRRFGFVDGKPGLWWSINGKLFPNVPMFVVAEGDIVRMRLKNTSGQVHPMHLHGHHALVLSRNGERATGSPWWVDSLNVANGETYEIAFRADNPGIWMDHCHNLDHAAEGLVAHLAYEGVTEPFKVGGKAHNHPE